MCDGEIAAGAEVLISQAIADVFNPCNGAWGERGATKCYLESAKNDVVRIALETAFKNVIIKAKKKKVKCVVGYRIGCFPVANAIAPIRARRANLRIC